MLILDSKFFGDTFNFDGTSYGYLFPGKRGERLDVVEAIGLRGFCDYGSCDYLRNIVPGFFSDAFGMVVYQRPEVRFFVFSMGSLDSSWSGVVTCPREMPVTKTTVEMFEISPCRLGGQYEVSAVVFPETLFKVEGGSSGGNKLPEASRIGAAMGLGAEAALYHREIDKVLRKPGFLENGAHNRNVAVGAPEPFRKEPSASTR